MCTCTDNLCMCYLSIIANMKMGTSRLKVNKFGTKVQNCTFLKVQILIILPFCLISISEISTMFLKHTSYPEVLSEYRIFSLETETKLWSTAEAYRSSRGEAVQKGCQKTRLETQTVGACEGNSRSATFITIRKHGGGGESPTALFKGAFQDVITHFNALLMKTFM